MSDFLSPVVRLVGPADLPVRIPDWPEEVGIAVCRANGRVVSLQPYHLREGALPLRRRLVEEVGDTLRGFAIHPPAKGIPTAKLSPAEDLQMIDELERALRSMPRLVEDASDFAINFEFAAAEGLTLDGLADATRAKGGEVGAKITDQLPVGYHPFVKPDPHCEVISGAMLRPAGAAGIDLLLVPERDIAPRELPAEASVMVREDSLRVAIPLASVLVNGALPKAVRLPAGALLLGQTGGKPVPAMVLRRGGFLFVAPDHSAVAQPVARHAGPTSHAPLPWKWIGLGVAGVALLAAVAVAVWAFLPSGAAPAGAVAPVQDLRQNLFAPREN